MIVDVAGSTERASNLGDRRWGSLLNRFEKVVQRTLLAHRGDLVKTAGDGPLATFDGPARAVRCACTIREAVQENDIEVRCGLHTGEVTRRAGDIAGIAVHIGVAFPPQRSQERSSSHGRSATS